MKSVTTLLYSAVKLLYPQAKRISHVYRNINVVIIFQIIFTATN